MVLMQFFRKGTFPSAFSLVHFKSCKLIMALQDDYYFLNFPVCDIFLFSF